MPKSQKGFTLQELLVVVTIVILLFISALALLNPKTQLAKGHDATRKSHLDLLRIAFEAYYSDNECYPTQEMINSCGSKDLSPYMESIPCDPLYKTPYRLELTPTTCPQQFGILTNLEFTQDPIIDHIGCTSGCGSTHEYNYIVTSGDATAAFFTPPLPTATVTATSGTPTPTLPPVYYCSAINNCTVLQDRTACPGYQIFDNPQCTDGGNVDRNCTNDAYVCNTPTP